MLDRVSSVDGADGRRTCASVKPPLIIFNAKTMSCMNKEQKINVFADDQKDRDPSAYNLDQERDEDVNQLNLDNYFTLGSKEEAPRGHQAHTCKNAERPRAQELLMGQEPELSQEDQQKIFTTSQESYRKSEARLCESAPGKIEDDENNDLNSKIISQNQEEVSPLNQQASFNNESYQ